MKALYRFCGLLAGLSLSLNVCAGEVLVEGVWARATAPGQDTAMVDLDITSKQAAKLVGMSSTACKSIELHSMSHEGGMMKMREVDSLTLSAGQSINLGKSGYHLMLIGLKAPLEAGNTVPLTLNIQFADKHTEKVEVAAEVRPLVSSAPQDGGHMHHH